MKEDGFTRCVVDHFLFTRSDHGDTIVIAMHVDDIIGNSDKKINSTKDILKKHFEMKDLERLQYFLGLKIIQSSNRILMNKKKYVLALLKEIRTSEAKDIDTSMETNMQFSSNDREQITNKTSYQRLIGKLIYLIATRPDIIFAVNKLSQFIQNLAMIHISTAHKILKCLHKTVGKVLCLQSQSPENKGIY